MIPTRPDNNLGNPEGPYCPGEKVMFTYTLDFTINPMGIANNCQWLQAIIPSIGAGWDLVACPIEVQGPESGWFWLPEGNVDHNVNSLVLGLQSSASGGIELVFGPGGLSAGDLLPGGWWFISNGNGNACQFSGDPDTHWGLPGGCGSSYSVTFDFFLQVKDDFDPIECTDPDYLKVHMFALSDGQTGCITNSTCDLDVPAIFNGTIDCDAIVGVTFGGEQSICPGNQTDISVSADDGNSLVIVEFDEENPGGAGPIGEADGEFILQQTNDNMSCDFELVILKAFTINPTSGCMGLADTLHLSFRPSLQVSLPTNLSVCLEDSVTCLLYTSPSPRDATLSSMPSSA